ncbi:MAG: hypothetical protein PUF72_01475 [Clostridiales bacterium]|nr:hypothetical protein [Clostridiales bacterium]
MREKYRQSDYKRFICRKTVTDDGEVAEKKIYSLNEEKILNEEKYDGFYAATKKKHILQNHDIAKARQMRSYSHL